MTTPTVTQNGKTVKLSTLKGKVNFAPGYRKDREILDATALKVGDLVIRERANDRTLIKVTSVSTDGFNFGGAYVTPTGKVVAEAKRGTFGLDKPVFRARPSR